MFASNIEVGVEQAEELYQIGVAFDSSDLAKTPATVMGFMYGSTFIVDKV